ncbi:MAG TPA: DUF222 domain-containing protein [Microlunatus sp.]
MFDRRPSMAGSGGSPGRSGLARSPREARAGRVADIRRSELRIEAMVLRDAAGWAIEHGVDNDDPFATGPAGGVGKYVASPGTPWIDEHVAKEYAGLRGTSTFEATDLIIDALDLRHRFPSLRRAVRDLRVRVRFARRISKACRDLSQTAAAAVDAELARKAAWGLPWARLEKILAAAIMNADPDLHRANLEAAKFDRQVWLSQTEDGLRTMVIKADAGDQILLYALIDRIAEIMLLDGDTDPVAVRRSKASGWLARPEDLVVLLYRHAQTGSPAPAPAPAPADESPSAHDHTSHDQDPEPEPHPPAWCYQPPEPPPPEPPDPLEPPGTRLGCDLPRLVDDLTTKGLKPVPPRVVLHVHLTDQTLLAGDGVVRSDDAGPCCCPSWSPCSVATSAPSACDRSSTPPTSQRWTATRSRRRCATPSGPDTRPRCSPAGPESISSSTTRSDTPTTPNPPGRPGSGTSDHSPIQSIRPRPTASGTSNIPTPASSCGAHPTATTSWSPTTAPKPSGPSPPHARRRRPHSGRSDSTIGTCTVEHPHHLLS